MAVNDLTAATLRDRFSYSAATGVFTRLVGMGRSHPAGTVAGTTRPTGIVISIGRKNYFAHRLAWLYVTGNWPDGCIDHIDGNPHNNAFANLREATHRMNMQNQRRAHKDAASKYIGVSRSRKHWMARIAIQGKTTHIGVYATEEEAHAAYVKAKRLHHEGCTL